MSQPEDYLFRLEPTAIFQLQTDHPGELLPLSSGEASLLVGRLSQEIDLKDHEGGHLSLSFGQLREVRLMRTRDKLGSRLTFIFSCEEVSCYYPLLGAGVESHEDAMRLLFRIARIIDWRGYRVKRNNAMLLDVSLSVAAPNVVESSDPFRASPLDAKPFARNQARPVPMLTSEG